MLDVLLLTALGPPVWVISVPQRTKPENRPGLLDCPGMRGQWGLRGNQTRMQKFWGWRPRMSENLEPEREREWAHG
jgi:hypothetical protein